MGSVLGRQASAKPVGNHGDGEIRGSMQAEAASGEVSEVRNSVNNSVSNDDGNSNRMENEEEWSLRPKGERRRSKPNPRLSNPPKHLLGKQVAAGWPSWLSAVAGEAINGWTPRRADTFEKIDKIGQGMYSNVYKARDLLTGKIVALKKVRFDNLEPESVRFMAREILILHRLDHPNVVKLEGLVTSKMSCFLYLVFEYMEHDLAGLAASPAIKFTESQLFTTKPYACEPSSLPKYPPRKEMDAKIWDVEATRLRAAGRDNADRVRKSRACDRKGIPAPEANAERQGNLDRRRLITHANLKSKSEKFPPPHQDGTLGHPLGSSDHIDPAFDPLDVSFGSTSFSYSEESVQTWSGPLVKPAAVGAPRRKQHSSGQIHSLSKPGRKDSKRLGFSLVQIVKNGIQNNFL